MRSTKSCSECGATFVCGSTTGSCWCAGYPAIMPPDFSRDCRCPKCLAKAIARVIEDRLAANSHEEALRLATTERPSRQLIEHIDYNVEDGNYVFSKWFLLKQGKCCGKGCRNCPYPPGPGTASLMTR